MSKVMDSKTFSGKLYNTLPVMYHNADSMVDYALKRYLQVLSDGGYSFVVDELNGILNLNDPERTPSEVLGILFEQYGLPLFNGIPEVYLRKLLPILGDLYARKGATTVIEYLTSIISDVKTDIVISPDFLNDYHIDLKLEMDYDQTGARDLPDREQLLRIIKEFLPFFIEVTIVFVYMFYESVKLQGRESFEDHVTEVRSEHSRLLSGNKEGLFPTLNNFDLGLNKSIYLNESYYYDVEVDWFKDHILTHILETGTLNRSKSCEYYTGTLNNPVKVLNQSVILNECMDSDELVSTDIVIKPQLDRVNLKPTEFAENTMTEILEEETGVPSVGIPDEYNAQFKIGATFGTAVFGNDDFIVEVEEYMDKVTFIQNDSATLKHDSSTGLFKGVLNNYTIRMNDNLYTNEGVDTDDVVDRVGLSDVAELGATENKTLHMVLNPFSYYATLNTGFLLNKDLITNESHTDIGEVVCAENFEDVPMDTYSDTETFSSSEKDEEIMAFTNLGVCALNHMILNSIPAYDKIIMGGEVTVVYPTQYGCISA